MTEVVSNKIINPYIGIMMSKILRRWNNDDNKALKDSKSSVFCIFVLQHRLPIYNIHPHIFISIKKKNI